ncbi:MAG: APC family permease [Candidatus Koribacter versatilis]|uniref:APC family permease n=1 Tax=Candidatus Korobacter versatilis TaxID=658062 RepID=A0A932A5Q0_9BACT|nr:APC family permease [Candidatus Koribacter versatilis]
MLTFISFWRAAAIVLNDLGSSAFYAGGIAEQAVGKAAPWFILGVMLFAFAVRAVYVESCSMFVRGGVYRVVKEALGGTLAKISVSALMFDYILTGPISGVSAGHYISGLLRELVGIALRYGWAPESWRPYVVAQSSGFDNALAVVFALAVTIYYWRENTKGIEESSEKALRVMQVTTVMVVILLGWSALTLMKGDFQLPPLPLPQNLNFSDEALGWLKHSDLPKAFGLLGILIAFGHSVLAMSGEESLAQVNRELAHPKLLNLKKAAIVIGIYSFMFTGLASLLAVMIIPDSERIPIYKDNLISGLAMHMYGPMLLRIFFRVFVVGVGFLMLSGAVNTAIIGSNGVLNRISEDGVLTDWFRKPHKKYGTSYRIINMVVGLQIFTILASRGDVYVLGEAYAFGVIWSFTFNSLSMLVLRWKYKGERGWKVPPNIKVLGVEIPLGLLSVHLVLLSTAIVNLFTKQIATIAGIVFAGSFFFIFVVSERVNRKKFAIAENQMKEHFQLLQQDTISRESVDVRPGNLLVTVRDYNTLDQLRWSLEHTDTEDQDVVVMAARLTGPGSAEYDLSMEQIFSEYEQTLFTKAVGVAEGVGKHISLLVVPARDVWSAIVTTANRLQSEKVIAGLSSKMTAEEQAFSLGRAWEAMEPPKRQFGFIVVRPNDEPLVFHIGPHNPRLNEDDVHLVHRMWLTMTRERGLEKLHHDEIVSESLTRFARDYSGREHDDIVRSLKHRGRDTRRDLTDTQKMRPLATPPPDSGMSAEPRPERALPEGDKKREKKKDGSGGGNGGPPPPPVVGP